MKKIDLLTIKTSLQLLNGIPGVKLGAARAELSEIVNHEVELMETFKTTDEWVRIDELLNEINIKHARKNDKGVIIPDNGMYVFVHPELREADIEALKKKEEASFKEREILLTEYKELLKEPFEKEFPKIALSLFPSDTKNEIIVMLWPVIDKAK